LRDETGRDKATGGKELSASGAFLSGLEGDGRQHSVAIIGKR
jgi:hypothetical protein